MRSINYYMIIFNTYYLILYASSPIEISHVFYLITLKDGFIPGVRFSINEDIDLARGYEVCQEGII